MLGSLHPTLRVEKPRLNPPQGHVPPPPLLQPVITRRWPLALRTFAAHAFMRLEPNIDRLRLSPLPAQFHFLINKSRKVLNRVQKGLKLELNSWSPFSFGLLLANSD